MSSNAPKIRTNAYRYDQVSQAIKFQSKFSNQKNSVIKIIFQQIYRTFRQHYERHNICNFCYQRFVDMHIDVSNSFSEYCIYSLSKSQIIYFQNIYFSLSLPLSLSARITLFIRVLLLIQHITNMSYMLLQSIMTTSAIVLIVFIMCYFGQTVTNDCEIPAKSIYNELWYQYPIKLQKSMIFIIGRSQHTYVFTAFKMYRCTLQSFSTVCVIGLLLCAKKNC